MTDADRATIQELAATLNRDAISSPLMCLALAGAAGALLGAALGGDTTELRVVGAVGYAIVGAFVGRFVGRSRAASLRLQAFAALRLLGTP